MKSDWIEFDIDDPPGLSGVYGCKYLMYDFWWYIGISQNIKSRLSSRNHPLRIAESINVNFRYFYICCSKFDMQEIEKQMIKTHKPIGNGGVSILIDLPDLYQQFNNRITPHGLACNLENKP